MILSLSTWGLSRCPIYQVFRTVKELGFKNIEFNLSSIERSGDSIYLVKRLISENNLTCASVHGVGFYIRSPDEVKTAIYYGKRSIDLADTLSSKIVVVHSFVSDRLSDDVRRGVLQKVFTELNAYSSGKGVQLALENLSKGSRGYGKTASELKEIFDISDMGMTLDFCHAKTMSSTLSLLETYKDKIKNIHISSDLHRPIRRITPHLDLFFTTLINNDYKGLITIELAPRHNKKILETKRNIECYFNSPHLIHLG